MERNSMSMATAVITAARVSTAAHVRARRVTPPQYRSDLDHKIHTAESSARAARMQAQLAEQRAARRSSPAACATGCRGACSQGRSVCEHAAFERRTHRVEWLQTEPMGYESAPAPVTRRTAADVLRRADVREALDDIRFGDELTNTACWIAAGIAVIGVVSFVLRLL